MRFLYGVLAIICGGLSLSSIVMTIPVYDMVEGGITTGKGAQWYYAMMLVLAAVVLLVMALLCYRKYKQIKISRERWFD